MDNTRSYTQLDVQPRICLVLTEQTATNPAGGERIRHIIDSFHADFSGWESDFESLFDDIDRFLDDKGPPASDSAPIAGDFASLKCLVEQQTTILTALVNALTGQSPASDSGGRKDDILDSVLGQFAQLQHPKNAATD